MAEPFKVTKAVMWLPVSNELADDADGFAEQIRRVLSGEAELRPDIVAELPESYRLMVERAEGVLTELLELHKPHQTYSHLADVWHCEGEPASGYEWDYADWPCETVGVIARHLGVELNG